MRLKTVALLAIIPFLFSPLLAQTECDDTYIKAMTAQTPAQKVQMLKDFIAKCGGKGSQYEHFAYANLFLIDNPGQTADGEKALALGGLDGLSKCQVLIKLSALYSQNGQNLDKAKSYAQQVVDDATAAKAKDPEVSGASPAQWTQFIGAGHYSLGQAQEKAKDYKGAVDSYARSYTLLKNPQILAGIKKLGKTLYDAKAYADAEKAFKAAYAATKDDAIAVIYAQSLYRNNKDAEALALFKEIHAKKKSGEIAYNIGIIMAKEAKTNPAVTSDAIRYLLEAAFTYPAQSKQAMQLAETLFFLNNKELKYNETVTEIQVKAKKVEELTKTYNSKFGNKEEDELNNTEKAEMESLLAEIEIENKDLERLQSAQNMAIAKFNKLLEDTKARLGIK